MVDWIIIASLATAAGTLVLALATFMSVRSTRRAALATACVMRSVVSIPTSTELRSSFI